MVMPYYFKQVESQVNEQHAGQVAAYYRDNDDVDAYIVVYFSTDKLMELTKQRDLVKKIEEHLELTDESFYFDCQELSSNR